MYDVLHKKKLAIVRMLQLLNKVWYRCTYLLSGVLSYISKSCVIVYTLVVTYRYICVYVTMQFVLKFSSFLINQISW